MKVVTVYFGGKKNPIGNFMTMWKNKNKSNRFSLFVVVMSYKVAINAELVNINWNITLRGNRKLDSSKLLVTTFS